MNKFKTELLWRYVLSDLYFQVFPTFNIVCLRKINNSLMDNIGQRRFRLILSCRVLNVFLLCTLSYNHTNS